MLNDVVELKFMRNMIQVYEKNTSLFTYTVKIVNRLKLNECLDKNSATYEYVVIS